MKRQNGVILSGVLANVRREQLKLGAAAADYVLALLITDDPAYGGHHTVIFPAEFALDVEAYQQLVNPTRLEATVEGWLRSYPGRNGWPGGGVVVVDRVIFLNVTQEHRNYVTRLKAQHRQAQTSQSQVEAARSVTVNVARRQR